MDLEGRGGFGFSLVSLVFGIVGLKGVAKKHL